MSVGNIYLIKVLNWAYVPWRRLACCKTIQNAIVMTVQVQLWAEATVSRLGTVQQCSC